MLAGKSLTLATVLAVPLIGTAVPTCAGPLNAGASSGSTLSGASATNWTLGGRATTLIEVPAATPVGTGSCPGVRPGAVVRSDTGQCTFNFLFDASDGRRYIGTAGHCILQQDDAGGDVGERTWPAGTGPAARTAAGNRIGEFAYAILDDPKDFALIRLDPGVSADAGMCHFGGPTGVNDDRPDATSPVALNYFGEGVGVGSVVPARSAVALGMPDPDHVYAQGAAVPGDSGSAVISGDGRAVGVLVTVGVHTDGAGAPEPEAGTVGITRLTPQLRRGERVLGVVLVLREAPLQ